MPIGYLSGDAYDRLNEASNRSYLLKDNPTYTSDFGKLKPPEVPTRKNYHVVYEDGQFDHPRTLCLIDGTKYIVKGIVPNTDHLDLTGQFYSGAWFVMAEGPMYVPWASIMFLK